MGYHTNVWNEQNNGYDKNSISYYWENTHMDYQPMRQVATPQKCLL